MTPPTVPTLPATAKATAKAVLHPDPGNQRKHRTGWCHLIDLATWPVAFVLDRNDRPATSKVMAFAILAAFMWGKAVPVTVVLALLAASFGYTAWKDFVAKGKWGSQSTDAIALAAKLEHTEHTERTIAETTTRHIDETIGRGPAGEPLRSNPPTPGALSPAEED